MREGTIPAAAQKLTLSTVAAAVLAGLEWYLPALCLLGAAIAVDYLTGVVNAWLKGALDSAVGRSGLIRKACYLAAVAVGFGADLLARLLTQELGLTLGLPALFGLLVTAMLTANELLSICENLGEIGVPLPGFLTRALVRLREKAESAAEEHHDERD